MMRRLILLASLATTLHAHASELVMTDTQRFIAALSCALERGVIGEAGLGRMLAACTKNALANPITELEAATDSSKLVTHQVVQEYLSSANLLDAKQVCTFVNSRLAALRKETDSREQVHEQTLLPFETPDGLPVMSLKDGLLCAVDHENNARCFGKYSWPSETRTARVPDHVGKVKSITSGGWHACAIRLNDTAVCWLAYDKGYIKTEPPANLGKVRAITAGSSHTCAIKEDGTVACWGGSEAPKELQEVIAIAAGGDFSCAIQKDGITKCWGHNSYKVRVPRDLGLVRSISAGNDHACAVTPDGMVRCWGNSQNGKTIPPNDLGPVRSVHAGYSATCALTTGNIARCWGFHGDQWKSAESFPLLDVAFDQFYFCGVTTSGHIRCLGEQWGKPIEYDHNLRVLGAI